MADLNPHKTHKIKNAKEQTGSGISIEAPTQLSERTAVGGPDPSLGRGCIDIFAGYRSKNKTAAAADKDRALDIPKVAMETFTESRKRAQSEDDESPKLKVR